MKAGICFFACSLLLGCAAQTPDIDAAAVEDFIAVRNLEEVDFMRISTVTYRDMMQQITDYHVRYKVGPNYYLVAFAKRCPVLYGGVTTDVRVSSTLLMTRADTIRGCRISRIYRLSAEDTAELGALGRPPANPN